MDVLFAGDLTVTGFPIVTPLNSAVDLLADVEVTGVLLAGTTLSSTVPLAWADVTLSGVLVPQAAPANDMYVSATVLSTAASGSIAFNNEFATPEVGDKVVGVAGNRTIWYAWVPSFGVGQSGIATFITGPDRIRIDDVALSINTKISVWHVVGGTALADLVFDADNDNGVGMYGYASLVSFRVVSGTTYKVMIDAATDAVGYSYSAVVANPAPTGGVYNYGPGTLTWSVYTYPPMVLSIAEPTVDLPNTVTISMSNVPPGPTAVELRWDNGWLFDTVTVDETGVLRTYTTTLPTAADNPSVSVALGVHTINASALTVEGIAVVAPPASITVVEESELDVPVDPIFPEPVPQTGVIKWVLQDPTVYTANEQQSVYFSTVGVNRPSAGTWKLTVSGNQTVAMPYNATAGQIQSSIVQLVNIGQYDVLVTGGPINHRPITIEFVGALARTNVVASSVSGVGSNLLTGPAAPYTISVDTLQEGGTVTAANPAEYIFPINPHAMTSPFGPKNITSRAAIGPTGQKIAWEGAQGPIEWQWEGNIFSQLMYEKLTLWAQKGNRVFLTDHYQRRWTVYITQFNPVPKRSVKYPWRHTYTMTALVFAGPDYVA